MSGLNQQFTKLSIRKDPWVRIPLPPPEDFCIGQTREPYSRPLLHYAISRKLDTAKGFELQIAY